MPLHFSKKNNPRVIIIQKLYSKYYNNEVELNFPKHRFKKFIKDVVNGTIERDDLIHEEITNHLNEDLKISNLDKVFQVIIKSAIFELISVSKYLIISEIITSFLSIVPKTTSFINFLNLCLGIIML